MEKTVFKTLGAIVLFIILIHVSIKLFNYCNPWLGILSSAISIIITYLIFIKLIKGETKK